MTLLVSDKTGFYSPVSFLSRTPEQLGPDWLRELEADLAAGKAQLFEGQQEQGSAGVQIVYRALPWDSDFFGTATFRVDYTAAAPGTSFSALQAAFAGLRAHLASQAPAFYLFAEVPSEDTAAIAGMSGAGYRLIETRLTCFRDDLQRFDAKGAAAVRSATAADIPELRVAAAQAVNHYDRFHADDFFSAQQADDFLAVFVENSVKGYADEVIVPADGPADAFLTGNYVTAPAALGGQKLGRMVLSAVTPARRGWYVKLIGALSAKFQAAGVGTAFMTTQATNRAVLKVWAHHGYRVGRSSHIFSTYSRG